MPSDRERVKTYWSIIRQLEKTLKSLTEDQKSQMEGTYEVVKNLTLQVHELESKLCNQNALLSKIELFKEHLDKEEEYSKRLEDKCKKFERALICLSSFSLVLIIILLEVI